MSSSRFTGVDIVNGGNHCQHVFFKLNPTLTLLTFSSTRLEAIKKQIEPFWQKMDFLVTPTAGQLYTIEQMLADPVRLNTNLGYYMNFMNLLDMTAVAVPTGFLPSTPVKMPFGITISSPAFSDYALLQLAARCQASSKIPLGTTESELPWKN